MPRETLSSLFSRSSARLPGIPYWRLSLFYFFFFGSLGALVPYWGLYLKSLDFSAEQIGTVMGLFMAVKIISPNIWGWIADHTGRRIMVIRLGTLLAVVCFSGMFVAESFLAVTVVMAAFGFFWNAALPQFEVTTLNHLGDHHHRYSQVRLWGSVGFIAAVAILGPVLDATGIQLLPVVVMGLIIGIFATSLVVPEERNKVISSGAESLRSVLRQPVVLALFSVCFLMQVAHGPFYTFYSIYLQAAGYSKLEIGLLWSLGVGAEVFVFVFLTRLLEHYSLRQLLLFAVGVSVARWLLVAFFVSDPLIQVVAQLSHAATFGVYHAVAIQWVHRLFTGQTQGRGQALYSSLSFGAGGAVGSLYSGYTWDSLGSTPTFLIASLVSVAGFLVAWRGLKTVPPG